MNELNERYGGQGLRILAVNLDQRQVDAEKFLQKMPARFAVVFDASGATARAYRVKGMPSSFLIDRHGNVQLEHVGFRDSARGELEAAIRKMLGEP